MTKYGSLGLVEERLHADEPVFVLRGQDILAPHAIIGYAALLEVAAYAYRAGADAAGWERSSQLLAAARQCRGFAASMVAWQANNPQHTKLPD